MRRVQTFRKHMASQERLKTPFFPSIDWSAMRQRDLLPTNEPVLSYPSRSRNITIEPTSQITKLHLYYAAPPEPAPESNYIVWKIPRPTLSSMASDEFAGVMKTEPQFQPLIDPHGLGCDTHF